MANNNDHWKDITAIIAIMILSSVAVWKDLDGQYLIVSIIAIAGIAGFSMITYLSQPKP